MACRQKDEIAKSEKDLHQKAQELDILKQRVVELEKENDYAKKDTKIWETLFMSLQKKYEGTNMMIPNQEAVELIKKIEALKTNVQELERDRSNAKKDSQLWDTIFKSLRDKYKGTSMMIPNEEMVTVMKEMEAMKMELQNSGRSPVDKDRKSFEASTPLNVTMNNPEYLKTERKIVQLQKQIVRMKSENTTLRARCDKHIGLKKIALGEKKTAMDAVKAISEINMQKAKEIEEMSKKIITLEKEITTLQNNGKAKFASFVEGPTDEASLSAEIQNLKRELNSTKEELNCTKSELDSIKGELDSTKSQLDSTKSELDSTAMRNTTKINLTNTSKRSSRKGSANGQTFNSCVENFALTKQNKDLQSEMKALKKRQDNYDTSITQLVTQHSLDIDILNKQNTTLTDSNKTLKEVYISQQKENDTLKKKTEDLQKENDTLKGQKDLLQKENVTLKEQKEDLQKENDTLKGQKEDLQKENDTLKLQKEDLQKEYVLLKGQKDVLQKENVTLKEQNEVLQKENDTLKVQKEVWQTENATLKAQKECLQKQNVTLKGQKEVFLKENFTLKVQKANMQKEYVTLKNVLKQENETREQNDVLQRKNVDAKEQCNKLKNKIETLKVQIDALQKENVDAREQSNKLKNNIETLKIQIDALQKEIDTLNNQKDALQSEKQTLDERIVDMQNVLMKKSVENKNILQKKLDHVKVNDNLRKDKETLVLRKPSLEITNATKSLEEAFANSRRLTKIPFVPGKDKPKILYRVVPAIKYKAYINKTNLIEDTNRQVDKTKSVAENVNCSVLNKNKNAKNKHKANNKILNKEKSQSLDEVICIDLESETVNDTTECTSKSSEERSTIQVVEKENSIVIADKLNLKSLDDAFGHRLQNTPSKRKTSESNKSSEVESSTTDVNILAKRVKIDIDEVPSSSAKISKALKAMEVKDEVKKE